jgi:bifunctional non-homologous end joining protein LigD
MDLQVYIQKRDFSKTPEPATSAGNNSNSLVFVIQKHAASHLHYDFRLEMDGVLKSWAIPKGPTTNPKVKHLAMMVEDHPFDYRNFEGNIPQGEYGGGTVIVWDHGTYEPIEQVDGKSAQEALLLRELSSGSLKIKLNGQKLKGEFALIKTQGMGNNGWLLIKHNDQFASTADITRQDRSVLSGKNLEEMSITGTSAWRQDHAELLKSTLAAVEAANSNKLSDLQEELKPNTPTLEELLITAPEADLPQDFKPMKPTLVDAPFNDPDWLFENKWDGYRAIAVINKHNTKLVSRNDVSFAKYYPIVDVLNTWPCNAIIDGEIVVMGKDGKTDFGALQNWESEKDNMLAYYVFDILWYEGRNLMCLPLRQRQAILQHVMPTGNHVIRQSIAIPASGKELFANAEKHGYEGIVAKQADSVYTPDKRSKAWLKIKVQRRQEVVIGGFTKNKNTAKPFSALLLGVYENGSLRFVGKVGTGFSVALQTKMMEDFSPYISSSNPFDTEASGHISPLNKKVSGESFTWLKPELICEVNFAEITKDGLFRQASFKGMRIDKKALDVELEVAKNTTETVTQTNIIAAQPSSPEQINLIARGNDTAIVNFNRADLQFTHLNKIFWPQEAVTKRDMLNYYIAVAGYMLPYLKDRPMSLNRFPDGIGGPHFYQKDVTGKVQGWATTFAHNTAKGEHHNYIVGGDILGLLWMAGQGCIEINPWLSRIGSPENPDHCVIDLDPDEQNTFDQVIEAAQMVKKILDSLGVPSYPKTSGSTGIHIYIPLNTGYTYEQSQMLARLIVSAVNHELPDFTTLERMTAARHGKMYLDFLQNRPEATIAGVYSLRPKPGATVSMPLHWDEVKPGLKMRDFTIFNAIDRLKETGDMFKGVLDTGIDLVEIIKKAQNIFHNN